MEFRASIDTFKKEENEPSPRSFCLRSCCQFLLKAFVAFLFILACDAEAASNQALVYQGRIARPNGLAINKGSVSFTLALYSPSPENCLLYSEIQMIDMTGSYGMFSLALGAGTRTDGGTHTFNDVFVNGKTLSGLTCSVGSSFAGAATDDRVLRVSFNDGGTVVNLSSMAIKSVPFALQAHEIDGWGIGNLVKVSTIGSPTTFTTAEMANAKSMTGASCALNEILKWNGTTWACAPDATGGVPSDASYLTKGIVQFNTDAATSGINIATGIATVNTGTSANQIVKLDGTAKLPAVDGSALTNLNPTNLSVAVPVSKGGTGLSALGTANQVLGVNNAGTQAEYKTLTAGTGITISHAAGSVTINATGGNAITALTGEVTAAGPGSVAATIANNAVTTPKLFTNPGVNRLVATDTTTGATLSPLACTAGQLLTWNVTTGWQCTNQSALSSGSFTGSLSGDVTGTQSATVVASVGGVTAANVASGAGAANAATNINTASTIVKRDASGNFSAGVITANLTGSVSGASSLNVLKTGDSMTGNLTLGNATAATSLNNYNSSIAQYTANYWNGTAGAGDIWSIQNILGAGANPTSTLTFSHTGSTGAASYAFLNGNVGIGTTTPQEKLDISNGSVIIRSQTTGAWKEGLNIVRPNTSSYGFTWWHTGVAANAVPDGTTVDWGLGFNANDSDLWLLDRSMTTSSLGRSDAAWRVSKSTGDTYFGGRVGVGTSTPVEKLQVSGGVQIGQAPAVLTTLSVAALSTDTSLSVVSTAGYPSSGTLLVDNEAMTYNGVTPTSFTGLVRGALGTTASSHVINSTISSYLTILQNTSTTPKMVITSEGKVGIGTPSPNSAKLHVLGDTRLEGQTIVENNSGASRMIFSNYNVQTNGAPQLLFGGSRNYSHPALGDGLGELVFMNTMNWNYGAKIKATATELHSATAAGAELSFSTTPNGSTLNTQRMVITQDGNVGIGATTPSQKLEVNGGVMLNTATAKPVCNASTRGTFWVTQGAVSVKDAVEVCAKDAADAFAWRVLY